MLRVHNQKLDPIPDEVVVFEFADEWAVGVVDEHGLAQLPGPPATACVETSLHWGSPTKEWLPEYRRQIRFNCGETDGQERDWNRLHNLGFGQQETRELLITKFQWTYGLAMALAPSPDVPPDDVVKELKEIWNARECVATPTKAKKS
jgi:hypothetical protein